MSIDREAMQELYEASKGMPQVPALGYVSGILKRPDGEVRVYVTYFLVGDVKMEMFFTIDEFRDKVANDNKLLQRLNSIESGEVEDLGQPIEGIKPSYGSNSPLD